MKSMLLRHRRLSAAAASAVVLYAIARFVNLAIGESASGTALSAGDIPYVGAILQPMATEGPITYAYSCHPHGGGTCTLSGNTAPVALEEFCRAANISFSLDGTEIQNRDEIIAYLKDAFSRSATLHDWNGTTTESTKVLFCFGSPFRKLYGVYDPDTQHFAMWIQFTEV